MYKYIFSFIFVLVLLLTLAVPAQASTTGQYYLSNSQQQQIAYLSNLVFQLQAQLAALQTYNNVNFQPYTSFTNYAPYSSGNSSSNEISRVVTGGVEADGRYAVVMDGELTFRRDSEARVWFEYGTNTNLSFSTRSIEINGDDGDTEDFKISAVDLDDNRVYYYRAVAEDDNGRYVEGVVKSFRFESRGNYNRNDRDDDDDDYDGDWSLDVDDDYYETGDTVSVDYEVEDEDDKNWVGLYEVGNSNKNYVAFKYAKDDEGTLSFRINREGEYEFRLFSDDSFDLEATSDEFEVED